MARNESVASRLGLGSLKDSGHVMQCGVACSERNRLFSRLWCVFEVAAYKKLNPQGTIKFKPVFVEAVVVGLLLSAYCFSFIFMTWRILHADGLEADAWVFAAFASWFVPLGIATYGLRIIFREKYRLLSELEARPEHFDCQA